MADPRAFRLLTSTHPVTIGEQRKNNFFENLRDSFMLDTSAGQLWDHVTLNALRAQDHVTEVDPNYSIWTDEHMQANLEGLPLELLRDLGNATSRGEAQALMEMYSLNMGRRDRLEQSGASFSRFMAGFADPVNLIPVPIALGKGLVGAVKSTFVPNAGIITGTELLRHELDPTSTGSETLMNITAGTLIATTITGGVGAMTSPRGRRWFNPDPKKLARRLDNAFNEENLMPGNLDISPGKTLSQWEMTRERFRAEIKPHLPKGVSYNQFMRGRVRDPARGLKFQGMRTANEKFGVRSLVRRTGEPGSLYEMLEMQPDGTWRRVALGSQRELVEGMDPLTMRQVDNFYSREAMDFGTIHRDEAYPEYFDRREEYLAQFVTDTYSPAGLRQARITPEEHRASSMQSMDEAMFEARDELARAKLGIRQGKERLARLERELRYRNQYSRPKEVVQADINEVRNALDEASADRLVWNERVTSAAIRSERMRVTNSPRGNDIAPGAELLSKFMGKSGQWPWYTLMENRFRTLAQDGGQLGAYVQQIAQRMSGSPGIYTQNELAGKVGTGGNVEFNAMTYVGKMMETKQRSDAIYANYAGYTQDAEKVRAGQMMFYRLKDKFGGANQDIISPDRFNELIVHNLAHGGDLPNKPPYSTLDPATRDAVWQAAGAWRDFFNGFRDEGKSLGAFATQRSIQRQIDYIDRKIERTRNKEMLSQLRIERDSMQQRMDNLFEASSDNPGGNDYFPGIWNPDSIDDLGQEQKLRQKLYKDFAANPVIYRNGKAVTLSTKREDVEARVENFLRTIRRETTFNDVDGAIEIGDARERYENRIKELKASLKEFDDPGMDPARRAEIEELVNDYTQALRLENFPRVGMPSPFLQRRLNFPNGYRDYLEFMVTDIEQLALLYTSKMSKRLEMIREFGDASLDKEADHLTSWVSTEVARARALGHTDRAKELERELKRVLEAMTIQRDRVYKTYGMRSDPDAISGRAVDLGLVIGATLHMGKSVQAQMLDLGNVIAFTGFWRFFGTAARNIMAKFNGEADKWNIAKEEVELSGRVQEVLMASRFHELMNTGGVFYNNSRTERALHNFGGRFFINNLMGPMTDMMYRHMGVMINDRILLISRKIARGEKLNAKETRDVARAGLTEALAKRIYRQWSRKVPDQDRSGNDILLPGTAYWDDAATVREFRAISANAVSSFIPTPGAVDKPNFMLSEDWGKVMMQYKAFPLMATQKIMMANMQRQDKMAMASIAALIFGGWMLDRVRRPDYIDLPLADQLYRSIELSGVSGIFSDMNSMLEGATANSYGIRPMLGLKPFDRDPNWASRIGSVAGPLPNTLLTAIHAFTSPDAGADDRARAVRYLIPYNNHFMFDGLFRSGQETLAESGFFGEP